MLVVSRAEKMALHWVDSKAECLVEKKVGLWADVRAGHSAARLAAYLVGLLAVLSAALMAVPLAVCWAGLKAGP